MLIQIKDPSRALTKRGIVERVYNELGRPKNQAIEVTKSLLLEIIKSSLEAVYDGLVSGFGTFMVKAKKARMGRNPATGENLMLDPRQAVMVKMLWQATGKVNQR